MSNVKHIKVSDLPLTITIPKSEAGEGLTDTIKERIQRHPPIAHVSNVHIDSTDPRDDVLHVSIRDVKMTVETDPSNEDDRTAVRSALERHRDITEYSEPIIKESYVWGGY